MANGTLAAPELRTTIVIAARIVHALTSSTAAAERARLPSGVRCSPRSDRIRASTGNAVTLMAAPRNSAKGANARPGGAKRSKSPSESTAPSAKGTTMLTWLIRSAVLPRSRSVPVSSSRPTRNM